MTARFSGLHVGVAGLGTSGQAVAQVLGEGGARLTLVDDGGAAGTITSAQVDIISLDLLVVSPGWLPNAPLVVACEQAGVPVWSEVELAWRTRANPEAPWLAVTGTNGKTTTVEMLTAMVAAGGRRVACAGNVGTALVRAVQDPATSVFAVELSSFQLHHTHSMRAHSAAVLNLAADHLDWHGSMEAYAAAKAKIYRGVSGACVYNAADPATRVMVEGADVEEGASAVGFTLGAPQVGELGLVDGVLVDRAFTPDRHSHARELATVEDLAQLAGPSGRLSPHVVANALAASALALSVGIEPDAIAQALRGFHVGAHRLQEVARAREVRFVDDSKATNAHAAGAALASFEAGQVVWIAGGLAKGAQFDSLIQQHADRLKAAVLIGKDHRDLAAALERHASAVPRVEVAAQDAGSVMDTAVRAAAGLADPGDVVLLAPASASMDQFDNYAARGDAFAAAARTLGE